MVICNFLSKGERRELKKIASIKPVVCCITNFVTVTDCANMVLAFGGRPIMSADISDVKEILKLSRALVLNIGTIREDENDLFISAGKEANKLKIPVVLDPCGCQATTFRFEVVKKLLRKVQLAVIKCNREELGALYKMATKSNKNARYKKISPQIESGLDTQKQAKFIAKKLDCVVCVSGETDIVTDGCDIKCCKYGNKIMTKITGCGCMLTCVVACFCAVNTNFLSAAHIACCIYSKKYKQLLHSHIKTAKTFC